MAEFSVLLPVYHRDDPDHFRRAIRSVTGDQELQPTELVIIRDGEVGDELAAAIESARSGEITDGVPVQVVEMACNVGLARALEAGLASCRHEIVARADADDISRPHRFAHQIPVVAGGIDLLGSAITEFEEDEEHPGADRVLPADEAGIRRMARFRDPFNHPSVVYRKSAVLAAGGYQHLDRMEDYWSLRPDDHGGCASPTWTSRSCSNRVGSGAYGRRRCGDARVGVAIAALDAAGPLSPLPCRLHAMWRCGWLPLHPDVAAAASLPRDAGDGPPYRSGAAEPVVASP